MRKMSKKNKNLLIVFLYFIAIAACLIVGFMLKNKAIIIETLILGGMGYLLAVKFLIKSIIVDFTSENKKGN